MKTTKFHLENYPLYSMVGLSASQSKHGRRLHLLLVLYIIMCRSNGAVVD